ncbi:hypothetical protein Pint_17597 [Pistacia integerrima]|uniref:Uncharacterized protein n=1 Tax=Pistacia integerrima TaxID=434235 RepID=A0ACC0YX39_9ROSI|nr:hypothetical protein Pint_17597 [Pistacia integerrima]
MDINSAIPHRSAPPQTISPTNNLSSSQTPQIDLSNDESNHNFNKSASSPYTSGSNLPTVPSSFSFPICSLEVDLTTSKVPAKLHTDKTVATNTHPMLTRSKTVAYGYCETLPTTAVSGSSSENSIALITTTVTDFHAALSQIPATGSGIKKLKLCLMSNLEIVVCSKCFAVNYNLEQFGDFSVYFSGISVCIVAGRIMCFCCKNEIWSSLEFICVEFSVVAVGIMSAKGSAKCNECSDEISGNVTVVGNFWECNLAVKIKGRKKEIAKGNKESGNELIEDHATIQNEDCISNGEPLADSCMSQKGNPENATSAAKEDMDIP